jgi:lysozyme
MAICVDLSSYQQGFDFDAFAGGGGLGVILKASEGTTVKDKAYPSDPADQAAFYLNCASPDQGERVVCDWEDDDTDADDVVAFLRAIADARPDLQLTVYSGHTAKQNLGTSRNAWLADNTSLWVAQYGSTVSWPSATWPAWSLWQYTDCGEVDGFDGPVDCNRFNGPDKNFLAWMGPAAPALPTVTLTVAVSQPIRLIVNGQTFELAP